MKVKIKKLKNSKQTINLPILKWALWGIFLLVCNHKLYAQPEVQKPARILFLLDASSSMLGNWTNTETRFKAASRIITSISDSIHAVNSDVAFAVRVFGNQYPAQEKNCFDSRLEVPFGYSNSRQIETRLKYLNPRGFSPIAWSLQETAENDFTESNRYAYSIILITDGGESCGGDICATVTRLLEKKISFKPYILSLSDYEPLKQQYDCLGKYLLVVKEQDIVPAIKTIIDDNRKILSVKTPGLKSISTVKPQPAVVKTTPVPVTIKEEPVIVKQEIAIPKQEPIKKTEPVVAKKEEPKPVVIVQQNEPLPLPKVPQIDRIFSQNKLKRLNMLYTLADASPVKVPSLKIKILSEEEKPIVSGNNTFTANSKPKAGIIEPSQTSKPVKAVATNKPVKLQGEKTEEQLRFTEQVEQAKETTVQIYFTNGQGKFYNTEPKLIFLDSKTHKEVKSIYRNVTAGTPEPIKIPAGTYDIAIASGKGKATNVVVEVNSNKKVYITIGKASMAFYYPTAPNRPPKEYMAYVSKRFEQGPVIKHRCDEELPYDPANYHIEINTLPALMYNIDLDFSSLKLVEIPEPGTIQISNQSNIGKIQFWNQRGDGFVPFHEMTITGNAALQNAEFLPGIYQLRYVKNAGQPNAKAEILTFRIKSNQTTIVELEK